MFTPTEKHGIYTLNLTSTGTDGIQIKEFGYKILDKPNKTIMFLGATGSGKTTLINFLINYIFGVEYKYEWRLELIGEETNKSQAHSQTSEITAYQINHQKFFRAPYSLTLVDTPGFGDTGGKEVDKRITEKINQFFSSKKGIESIDAVCLVVQAALGRLTEAQTYIFNSVLNIFGKDIASNVMIMITFADESDPVVLHAIKEAKFPCAKNCDGNPFYFKFNNSSLLTVPENAMGMEMTPPPSWKFGEASMENFFNHLHIMSPKSLTLTREVLQERRQLQEKLRNSKDLMDEGLIKLNEITTTEEAVKGYQDTADASRNFTYEVEGYERVVIDLGHNTTYCPQCNYTCHTPCGESSSNNKKKCNAMSYFFWSAGIYCNACPSHCHWKCHINQRERIETKKVKKQMTYEDLKKKFDTAVGMKLDTEKALQKLKSEYDDSKKQLLQDIHDMVKCLTRLQEIALHPVKQSVSSFIEEKIEAEQKEAKPGYQKRVDQLRALIYEAQKSEEKAGFTDKRKKPRLDD